MGAAWRVRNAVNSIRMERVRRPKTRRQGSGQTLGVYSPIVILSSPCRAGGMRPGKKLWRGHGERVFGSTCAAANDQRSISYWEFLSSGPTAQRPLRQPTAKNLAWVLRQLRTSPNALSRRQDGEEGVVALRTALDWPGRQTLRWFLVTSEALPRTRSE
jgi:hypothetical protein